MFAWTTRLRKTCTQLRHIICKPKRIYKRYLKNVCLWRWEGRWYRLLRDGKSSNVSSEWKLLDSPWLPLGVSGKYPVLLIKGEQNDLRFAFILGIVSVLFFLRFYLFTFLEREGKGGREASMCKRYINRLPLTRPPTGDLAHNPGMCPDW